MSREKGKIISVLLVAGIIVILSLMLCFGKKQEYSLKERRRLKEFPRLTTEAVLQGRFGAEFEEYTLEHFPFREQFRAVKAIVSQSILGNKDQKGLYKEDGYLIKMEYPLNMEMLEFGVKKLQGIYEKYLKNTDSKCYLSIVPDKHYYFSKGNKRPAMNYEQLFCYFSKALPFAKYLDITGLLRAEDYYKTDTHWRQEKIRPVADFLGKEMGADVSAEYRTIKADGQFSGVYAGQWSLPVKGEDLYYLTNDMLENCKVYSVGEKQQSSFGVYDLEKVKEKDPYEMFLSGTKAILVIENPMAYTHKELIVFRDSFGSSLVPLLIPGYAKITLVDIRYVQSNILERYIEFNDQDILFLYSTLILNQSRAFK